MSDRCPLGYLLFDLFMLFSAFLWGISMDLKIVLVAVLARSKQSIKTLFF